MKGTTPLLKLLQERRNEHFDDEIGWNLCINDILSFMGSIGWRSVH